MPKYRVYGIIQASKYIGEFEANSPEEAERMAWDSDEAYVSMCYQCAREAADPEIRSLEIEEVTDERG